MPFVSANLQLTKQIFKTTTTDTITAAAAAAKSLQSCLTLWPHRWQPTRLLCPWDSPGKNTGVGCHFLLQCMKVKRESEVTQSCLTLSNPMDCSPPGSFVHGIFQAMTKPRQHIKKQRRYFANKGLYSQSYGFFSSHVWMWELDNKNICASKSWWLWTVVLEKTLESPFDCKEIQPVNPKGNQPWIFIGRIDAEVEAPVLCHLMQRADSLEKTLMLGKIEGRKRRGDGGWDGQIASPTQWTWIWATSGR